MRRFLALLLLIAIAPTVWLRSAIPPPSHVLNLRFQPLPLPSRQERARLLGPFELEAAWQMKSTHANATGFSAILPQGQGRLLAISDRGYMLGFSPPGASPISAWIAPTLTGQAWQRSSRDAESASMDPATGRIWIGWESDNAITRHAPPAGQRPGQPLLQPFGSPQEIRPHAMRDWGTNAGPEAMVRLADGRFIVLREGFSGWFEEHRHAGLLFAGDPLTTGEPERFMFAGPEGFSPTDMAQLPDGRVLVLMRRLLWPLPARFEGRIVVADPTGIREGGLWRGIEVAQLAAPLPVDNFEGLAIAPRRDGTLTVWLISDDNNAAFQRSLLWKLDLDPAKLPPAPSAPGKQKGARANRTPSA